MIETTIPEINVSDLMKRVRAKAAEAQKTPGLGMNRSAALKNLELPPLEAVPPPPPLILPQPAAGRRERVLSMLETARKATEVSTWIPKTIRRFFRKQGGYNRMLLESVAVLTKGSDELANRLGQLTACIEVQSEWLEVLHQRLEENKVWMSAAGQALGAARAEIRHEVQEQSLIIERRISTRLSEWRMELDGIGKHLRNLQVISDRSSAIELALQKGQGELLSGFQRLREDGEQGAEHVRNMQKELERHAAAELSLRKEHKELLNGFQSLRGEGERSGEHLRNLQDETARNRTTAGGLRREFDGFVAANTALTGQLSRLEERLTAEGAFLRAQLSHHSSLFQRWSGKKAEAGGASGKLDSNRKVASGAFDERFDAFYMSFEDRFRGPRDEIKERISFYLPYIWESNAGAADLPVLDLGCGRGEWLELLRDIGASARGVDINSAMLALCRQRNLDVIQADALEYLRSLPDNSQSAVTGFHIIEHLGFDTLMDVLTETQRVVAPGGLVIFESPNCKNLIVGACNFNIDPTHRNPVFPDTAKFMLDRVGFERIEIEYLTPIATTPFDGKGAGQPILKDLLYGPQDFAVIGFKAIEA